MTINQIDVVEVKLDGTVYHLRPGREAAFNLSQLYGGIVNLQRRLLAQDLRAYVDIVLAGTGELDPLLAAMTVPIPLPARAEVERALYREGLTDAAGRHNSALMTAIDRFVAALVAGGRDVAPPADGEA